MPILGNIERHHEPQYFRSLKELDTWAPGQAPRNCEGIQKYVSRRSSIESLTKGKLLICHDYKGGYTESLFSRCYTFNFWFSCDTFVYFSHNRVTVPPPGWISAAHRQGVKMLGTLIFEGGAEEDCLRLLVGKIPTSAKTGQVTSQQLSSPSVTLPLSPHYATVLAELAAERGFDGYLLNFECPIGGGFEQTRALAAWITLLQSEILEKVGPHGETLWYDSVVISGQLAWQDRLNSYNLPYFLSSTGLFSNYTWRNDYPALTAQYFLSLDPTLISNSPSSQLHSAPKTLQDIYMGVDVWGRGSHGGGGFGSYKAISHISPESLGLSVALFGQAWTWETEQDKPGWTWDAWWQYERKLWVGPLKGAVDVPKAQKKKGEEECSHGPFVPLTSFFTLHPPPDPADLKFHTTFCPGTGLGWFVEGVQVYESKLGWTDVDKQTSVGDLIWPCPKLYWDDDREDPKIPTALAAFCLTQAWNGGNSMRFTLSLEPSEDEQAAYRSLWMPMQSLHVTPEKMYQASAIYKTEERESELAGLDTEFALIIKPLPGSKSGLVCNVAETIVSELAGGWTKMTIRFHISGVRAIDGTLIPPPSHVALGLIMAILTEDATKPAQLSFLLGQLNVSPFLPASYTEEEPIMLWADYSTTSGSDATPRDSSGFSVGGTLSWQAAASFPVARRIGVTSPEDPISAWNTQPTISWFPSFIYCNIYAQPFKDEWNVGGVDEAKWIGTSGWDGMKNSFQIVKDNLIGTNLIGRNAGDRPGNGKTKVRFYVQGVTDKGDALKWDKCVYVDADI